MTLTQRQVRIVELADRYVVLDAETGENADPGDPFGFVYAGGAADWAVDQGYEVVEEPPEGRQRST